MSLFARAFSIDYRSLRFCRFALGLVTLVHAAHMITHLETFFSERGLVPFDLVSAEGALPVFSFFAFSPSLATAGAHFVLLGLGGLGLLFNRFPRACTLVCYVMTLSVNNRLHTASFGVDTLLATGYLWLSFLPAAKPAHAASNAFTSLASIAALLQIAYLYVFAGLIKSWDFWFTQGAGAYLALQADVYARPLGSWAAENLPYPILQAASRAVIVWERFAPLLIFSPWFFPWCRMLVFVGFALMHLQFAVFMALGLFPAVDLVFLILLIPGEFWDWILSWEPLKHLPPLKTGAGENPPLDLFAPAILTAFFCITVWNLKRLDFRIWVPRPVRWVAKNLSLNQNWGMFAPYPYTGDGWIVIQGTTLSGLPADVLRRQRGFADFRKPKVVSAMFGSERWFPVINGLHAPENEAHRLAFARYFCETRVRGEALKEVRVWFVAETTVPKFQKQPIYGRLLVTEDCSLRQVKN